MCRQFQPDHKAGEWDSRSVSFARLRSYKVKSIVFSLLRSPCLCLMDFAQ